jgi:beta-N-acetylhexosaminidase
VLGPVVDVGFESGSALGERVYSDDAEEVAAYAEAVVHAYRGERLFGAVKHFPGLGAADQPTQVGPASVGLDLPQLRDRDLIPFRAAVDAGAPAVLLAHALYPMNDFTRPASLDRSIATELLRGELGFAGVAITDDLADPAIASSYSVPDAAVEALRAGADMLFVSGPAGDQQAAYEAVLRAAQTGELPLDRIDQALGRVLEAKRDYGLIR